MRHGVRTREGSLIKLHINIHSVIFGDFIDTQKSGYPVRRHTRFRHVRRLHDKELGAVRDGDARRRHGLSEGAGVAQVG